MYIPPYQILARALDPQDGEADPQLLGPARALIRFLLQDRLTRAPFDEDSYLAHNPDVATAIRRGDVAGAHEHYASHGYFEGREGAGPSFDESWYLKRYPDVALAVRSGQWLSGWQHYRSEGAFEWRSPSRHVEAEVERWRAMLTRQPAMAEPALFD